MTLATADSRFSYDGDATTTAFSYPRKVIEAAHLKVYIYDEDDDSGSLQVLNTDYTFSGSGLSNGIYATATITFTSAPGTDKKVVIFRDPTLTQEADFTGEANVLNALNRFADRVEMKIQRLDDRVDRAIVLPDGDYQTGWSNAYAKLAWANKIMGFDDDGDPVPVEAEDASSTAVTATGSTTSRTLANRFAEVYNVKDYGATGNGSTDDYSACQAAATACRVAGGGELFFPTGTYITTQSVLVGSNTRVRGAGMDATVIKAHQSAFAGTHAGNTCYLIRNYTHSLTGGSLTDSDISVEELTLDYGTVTISGGGAHAISMSGVDRVTVRRVKALEGENVTAFRGCKDTLVDNCHGFGQSNCFFDHWEGASNQHVINCTGRLTSGTIAQGIMFTGTGSAAENLSTTDCLVAFCSLYGVRNATDSASAIISNANDADSTTYRFRSIGNYVEDSDYGLIIAGEGGQAISSGDTFRNVTKLVIGLFTGDSDTPDYCRVLDPTLIDCNHAVGSVAMISIAGSHHEVSGVKVINTTSAAYTLIAWLTTTSSYCYLEITESDPGSTGSRWQNNGTNNRIVDFDTTLQAQIFQTQAVRMPTAGTLKGLTMANGTDATNDIDFTAGWCADSTGAALITCSALTKQLDAVWAAGTGAGGLDAGTIANATYHCHAIRKDTNGTGDFIYSLSHDKSAVVTMTIATPAVVTMTGHGLVSGSPIKFSTTGALPTGVTAGTQYYVIAAGLTADAFEISASLAGAAVNTTGSQSGVHTCLPGPVMPSNYTYFRRVGSIIRAGATILAFTQDADEFLLKVPVDALAGGTNNPGTSAVSATLTVPVGLKVRAKVAARLLDATPAADTYVLLTALDQTDTAPTAAVNSFIIILNATPVAISNGVTDFIRTNTSAQIRYRIGAASTTDHTMHINTHGWIDTRGRLV